MWWNSWPNPWPPRVTGVAAVAGPAILQRLRTRTGSQPRRGRRTIGARLIRNDLLVIAVAVVVFGLVGTSLVNRLVVAEAQRVVQNDLNAARAIFLSRLSDVHDVVRLTADRFFLKEALRTGRLAQVADELGRVRAGEGLDFLTVTDEQGTVLVRTSNPARAGDNRSGDELLSAAQSTRAPVSGVAIWSAADLWRESPDLAERAYIRFVETPKARPRAEMEETAGMVLEAAAPIWSNDGELLGLLYGGMLLNRNYEIVDRVKSTVFQALRYHGRDVGTATIFLDDVRIATNVLNRDGTRAVGTRIAADVYARVVGEGQPWIGRAFVVNAWYITAYEPIRSIAGRVIGILYVGMLEDRYVEMRRRAVAILLGIALAGGLISMAFSYHVSRRISAAVHRLVSASRELTHGNLGVTVRLETGDELEDLAEAFTTMAAALQARDEQLKEQARTRLMQSERLAITGQLAAGVAHELNNPLQGILAYSHLLLELLPVDHPVRDTLQKIADQANRSREIIRGLLDFARPRPPQVKPVDLNAVLQECVALVENQAMFHNIRVTRRLQPDLPPAVADPAQMQQVFMNLIVNAAEAMEGGGELTLVTRVVPPGRIEVECTDTGHGISSEHLEHIFDPFFTTKAPGRGVGLGLAISYGIIREHRGTIGVHSTVGRGTTFTIVLPAATSEGA